MLMIRIFLILFEFGLVSCVRCMRNNVKQDKEDTVICDQSLPQLSSDILVGHHAKFHEKFVEPKLKTRQAELAKIPPETCEKIKSLQNGGLTWNALGMDFRGLVGKEGVDAAIETISKDILPWYFSDCDCDLIMRHDFTNRYKPKPELNLKSFGYLKPTNFQQFIRDGFLEFDNLGVDVTSLSNQISRHFSDIPEKLNWQSHSKGVQLDGLEPIINNQDVLDLASYYLGTRAIMTGYKILRVHKDVERAHYTSGYWHHDKCGSRLKMFIHLQDVGEDGIPTEVAAGSQNTLFYDFHTSPLTRYDDEYVANNYPTKKLLGKAGGGFLFDTNAIHRGNVDGSHLTRDSIILDLAASDKLNAKPRIPDQGPCPEGETFVLPGWEPTEEDKKRGLGAPLPTSTAGPTIA